MAERPGARPRRIGMRSGPIRSAAPGLVVGLVLVLSGCGDDGGSESGTPSPSAATCAATAGEPAATVTVDLDGDGTAETVDHVTHPAGSGCPDVLTAEVRGQRVSARVDSDLPVRPEDLAVVRVPGRDGDLLLLTAQHPRGGFRAHLFGYADGEFAELTAGGAPLFDFIATDVLTTPTSATCQDGGFVVTQAKAHEPIGVVPAWDVFRTTYTVDGNEVTKGPTTEVADNVLDEQLHQQYAALVDYAFFEDCRVEG